MESIVDELLRKLGKDPGFREARGPRQDLGLLLFAERERINALWKAAATFLEEGGEAEVRSEAPARAELRAALEALRPLFGER